MHFPWISQVANYKFPFLFQLFCATQSDFVWLGLSLSWRSLNGKDADNALWIVGLHMTFFSLYFLILYFPCASTYSSRMMYLMLVLQLLLHFCPVLWAFTIKIVPQQHIILFPNNLFLNLMLFYSITRMSTRNLMHQKSLRRLRMLMR